MCQNYDMVTTIIFVKLSVVYLFVSPFSCSATGVVALLLLNCDLSLHICIPVESNWRCTKQIVVTKIPTGDFSPAFPSFLDCGLVLGDGRKADSYFLHLLDNDWRRIPFLFGAAVRQIAVIEAPFHSGEPAAPGELSNPCTLGAPVVTIVGW